MSHTYDATCLYSTVKNSSGKKMKMGFLPPHGRELDIDEEFTVYGDVRQAITGFDRNRQNILAFEAAITRGDLQILHTPSPIMVDATTDASKMLKLNNGTLSAVDPCWLNSTS